MIAAIKAFFRPIRYLVVHHMGTVPASFPHDNPVPTIRAWHKQKGWSDIGYHKVISKFGKVFQGRPDAVVGAHAFGLNTGSLGILVADDFTVNPPNDAEWRTLVQTLAILCVRHKLKPATAIIGHRDVSRITGDASAASACPGNGMYPLMAQLRREVQEAM